MPVSRLLKDFTWSLRHFLKEIHDGKYPPKKRHLLKVISQNSNLQSHLEESLALKPPRTEISGKGGIKGLNFLFKKIGKKAKW